MGLKSRQKAARRRDQAPGHQSPGSATTQAIAIAERERIAEAAHRAVCEITGDDGFGECLLYAVAGWSLLHDRGFRVQAGALKILADPDPDGTKGGHGWCVLDPGDGGFDDNIYHCWLARQVGSRVEVVDLASRHYRRYVTGLPWSRPDEPPTSLWISSDDIATIASFIPDENVSRWASGFAAGLWRFPDASVDSVAEAARRHYIMSPEISV